jgi:DNA topoisomerase-2
MIDLIYQGQESDVSIKDMFDNKRADKRKDLLLNTYNPDMFVDYVKGNVTWTEYLHAEVLAFSYNDNERNIAFFGDGLKPSQRAIAATCLKHNFVTERKIVEIGGKVTSDTHYGHGEQSLNDTIVLMAQDFWGTNNINLLYPAGQFGGRTLGRDSSASPRYLFTHLNVPIVHAIFPKIDLDLGLCPSRVINGEVKEPETLLPVLPLVLVNGTHGIGTGWSSDVLSHNPLEVSANMRRKILNEPLVSMLPWFAHFKGKVSYVSPQKYMTEGQFVIEETTKDHVIIKITELPMGVWRDPYKLKIMKLYGINTERDKEIKESRKRRREEEEEENEEEEKEQQEDVPLKNVKPFIWDFDTYECTKINCALRFKCDRAEYERSVKGNELKVFRLVESLSASNMVLWGPETGKLEKFTVEGLYDTFFEWRLNHYKSRRQMLISSIRSEIEKLSERARFIRQVAVDKTLVVANRPKDEIVKNLVDFGYVPHPEREFGHLLGISLLSLTKEMVDKLEKEMGEKQQELSIAENTSPQQFWLKDLDIFDDQYQKFVQSREERYSLQEKEDEKDLKRAVGPLKKKSKK